MFVDRLRFPQEFPRSVGDPEGQTPQWSAMAPSARCTVLAPRDRTSAQCRCQLPKKAKMAQEKLAQPRLNPMFDLEKILIFDSHVQFAE